MQIESSNDLGNGDPGVCTQPNINDGVAKQDPPDFGSSAAITDKLLDFACRFGRFNVGAPCTLNANGIAALANPAAGPTEQFCSSNLSFGQVFPQGDTLLTVQLRDLGQNLGPTAQVVVRVVTPGPPPP